MLDSRASAAASAAVSEQAEEPGSLAHTREATADHTEAAGAPSRSRLRSIGSAAAGAARRTAAAAHSASVWRMGPPVPGHPAGTRLSSGFRGCQRFGGPAGRPADFARQAARGRLHCPAPEDTMRKLTLTWALLAAGPFLPGCRCPVVQSGNAAIVFETLGAGTSRKVLSEGMHLMPVWNGIIPYDMRVQELKEALSVLSNNGLALRVDASVRYRPKPDEPYELQTQIGPHFAEIVVAPVVRSEARKVFGRYAPDEIYSTRREEIEKQIFDEVQKALAGKHVIIEAILVREDRKSTRLNSS